MAKFKVKKGKKFFWGPRWNLFCRNNREFNVKAYFFDDCAYRLTKNYDQVNKLTGWSYNLLPFYDDKSKSWKPGHHKNSVRFGWRCVDGQEIEILAYAYIEGIRKEKLMVSVPTGEWVHLHFEDIDGFYRLRALTESGEGSLIKFKKSSDKKGFLGLFIHRLFPYFGGKIASPHKMTIKLKY